MKLKFMTLEFMMNLILQYNKFFGAQNNQIHQNFLLKHIWKKGIKKILHI